MGYYTWPPRNDAGFPAAKWRAGIHYIQRVDIRESAERID